MDSSLRVLSGAITDRGLSEKRPQNEDSYLDMAQCGIFAVADGVGGAQAGEVASQMAMEILGEAFANLAVGADAETVMRTAIERANTAIFQMAHELPQLASMATTVVALHLADNIATIGHVGDSRLYRVDGEGNLYRETDDHSMVAEEVRAGRMTEEQAENHPSRNIISRALGAEPAVEVDLRTIMVEPGNAFLICSDGITRHVNDQEIKGVLAFGGDPSEVCDYLKGLCYERGAEDNLTAVVVKVSTDAPASVEPGVDDILDVEEPTISTARTPFESKIQDDDDDGLLELETQPLMMPDGVPHTEPERDTSDDTIPSLNEKPFAETPPAAEIAEVSESEPQQPVGAETFPMPADAQPADLYEAKPNAAARFASAAGLFLLGGIIGLGIYHFALAPAPAPANTGGNPLSEMRSENIAFSTFEKNRRNVDADPAAYLKEVPPPEDAEDFYLVGRANMLNGDFPQARSAFIEAQKRIANAEVANARILATDIAVALLITNDSTLQNRLKIEIDGALKPPITANTNSNR